MANIIILYSTTDGFTPKVCEKISSHLIEQHSVAIHCINDASSLDLLSADSIIIGASIRYGKHHKKIHQFIEQNQTLLASKVSAFFSINVVARKPEKRTPETNPYVKKFLNSISWTPDVVGVFAGKLNYQQCSFFDRHMIRLIMKVTKGPTDLSTNIEFIDWLDVETFAEQLKLKLIPKD